MTEGTLLRQSTVASEQQPFKKHYEHTASVLQDERNAQNYEGEVKG
jgi:hypothetical protein